MKERIDLGCGFAFLTSEAHEDTADIGIDDRMGPAEGQTGDRCRSVGAKPGKSPEGLHVTRESTPVVFDDDPGGRPEIPGPAVVAKALPGLEDFL